MIPTPATIASKLEDRTYESWMGLRELNLGEDMSVGYDPPAENLPTYPLVKGDVFRLAGRKRSGLYLDTGAAENLSGEKVLLEHQSFLGSLSTRTW